MKAARRFIFCAVGSAGDVFPFMAIAKALQARGEEVLIIAHDLFEEMARKEGIPFAPLGSSSDFEDVAEDPDLWHPRRGFGVIMNVVGSWLRPAYAYLKEVVDPEKDILVLHALCFWGRVHQEMHGTRGTTLHLAPSAFRSFHEMPALAPGKTINGAPVWMKRGLWWLVDRFFLDPILLPHLNPWRAELGLPPIRRVFKDWCHATDGVITLFPDWFGKRQPDWPRPFASAGFPIFDGDQTSLAPDLKAWLDAGTKPIVVTPGSANVVAGKMVGTVVEAALAIDRRVLVLAQRPDGSEGHDPEKVRHETWAPLGLVAERAAILVHHGGIGSTARGCKAGIPQLVLPMSFDQPDNATRVQRLGLGDFIAHKDLQPARVAKKLEALLNSQQIQEECQEIAAVLDGNGAERAAAALLDRYPPESEKTAESRAPLSSSSP